MGMNTKPSRFTGLASETDAPVATGIIESRSGRAMLAPIPRRNVRRGRDFLVRYMGFSHGERNALDDAEDNL